MNYTKGQQKLLDRITVLEAIENPTLMEIMCLANAKLKICDKTISSVFNKLFGKNVEKEIAAIVKKVLGTAKAPMFAEFKDLITKKGTKEKFFWSTWEGILSLGSLNRAAALATKLKAQGGTLIKVGKEAAQANPVNAANTAATKRTRAARKAA